MNSTLVGDMWLYLCLGLRPNELKKINLFTKNGKIAKFLRIKEDRSGAILTRYVPSSLALVIDIYKMDFPLTEKRLSQVR